MKDYRLRINEVCCSSITRPLTMTCPTDSPAVLSLLGSPPCQGGPKHRKTVAAADWGHRDITAYRVSNSTACKQTLTGGPSLPGRPCAPFFPWGPCWIKGGMLGLSFSNKRGKTQEKVFYLFSRYSNQPLRTRKTLQERHRDCFLFVSLVCYRH